MPKKRCSFGNCNKTNEDNVRMYRFPREKERCQLWVNICRNDKIVNIPAEKLYSSFRVCQMHFEDWCFMNAETKLSLTKTAVPEITKDLLPVFGRAAVATPNLSDAIPSATQGDTPNLAFTTPVHHTPNLSLTTPVDASSLAPITPHHIHSTPRSSRIYTPRKYKLAKLLKYKNKCLNKLHEKHNKLKAVSETWKSVQPNQLQKQLVSSGVNEKLANFIKHQVKLCKTKPKGKRYTAEDKIFAYSIYSRSSAAYRVLRQLMQLPSERTLREFLAGKFQQPGLNLQIVNGIGELLRNKPPIQRNHVLIFDEMSLKPLLEHHRGLDLVIGFEDQGTALSRTQCVANHVLVLLIRSLCGKRKMPIGFFFSRNTMPADDLKELITHAIDKLYEAGIQTRAAICDQGSNNNRLFHLLGVTKEEPYFKIADKKIFAIHDPPHLLKSLRRNLMKYDLQTMNGIVSFKHIEDFFRFDQHQLRKCAPKLTKKHIYAEGINSMKVALAAQVFSNTVAASMSLCISSGYIEASAAATVEFIGVINDLFDSLNGSTKRPLYGKPYHCVLSDTSPHLAFWNKLKTEIASWKFVARHNEKNRRAPKPLCKNGWLQTLTAVSMLYSTLKSEGIEYLIPRRLNQDCLENFFSRVRGCGGHGRNPSAYDVQCNFKMLCINSWNNTTKYGNCEDDNDKFCLNLIKNNEKTENASEETFVGETEDLELILLDNIQEETVPDNLIEENIQFYLAGYIAKRCIKETSCETCKELLIQKEKTLSGSSLYTYFKAYYPFTDHGLLYPSPSLLDAFVTFTKISDVLLHGILYKVNVTKQLQHAFEVSSKLEFLSQCSGHDHPGVMARKIVKISSMLCLKIYLREVNSHVAENSLNLKKLRDRMKERGLRGAK